MTEKEASENLRLIKEAMDVVFKCATESQKISHDVFIANEYSEALFQLQIYLTKANVLLEKSKIMLKSV